MTINPQPNHRSLPKYVDPLHSILAVGVDDHRATPLLASEGESFAKKNSISCFRGSENDVMGRVLNASHKFNADLVIEITGDCPLIDPNLVSQAIEIFINNDVNYVNNNSLQ